MDASVDLHFHLLAGVDDGPTDLTERLEAAIDATWGTSAIPSRA